MNDQLSMFGPTTSEDIASAISLPESESGPTPCVLRDGQTTVQCGLDRAHANPSAQPVKVKRSTTKGIYGQSAFASSRHDDLSSALASRYRALTDSLGSTLFEITWMTRLTPAGFSIPAQRASEARSKGSVFIGSLPMIAWPTPQKHDERERGNTMADHHYFPHDLSNAATMAAWPTPQSSDMSGGGQAKRSDGRANLNDFAMLAGWKTPTACTPNSLRGSGQEPAEREAGGHAVNLQDQVRLAGWKTPCVPNGGRISGNKSDIGKRQDGTKAQIGLENEAKLRGWSAPKKADGEQGSSTMMRGNLTLQGQARLGSWPTPMAGTPAQNGNNEAGNCDSSRKTVAMCQWPNVDRLTDFGDQPIGYLLGPNGWEILPASGQLNAAHSRWLMGLPPEWDDCGVTAMGSLRGKRRHSSEPTSKKRKA